MIEGGKQADFLYSRGAGMTAVYLFLLYIQNETRPLSRGITAVYLFLIYTERNAAVKSWDNGRFSFGHYIYRTS